MAPFRFSRGGRDSAYRIILQRLSIRNVDMSKQCCQYLWLTEHFSTTLTVRLEGGDRRASLYFLVLHIYAVDGGSWIL
jgi:hypothetical protein